MTSPGPLASFACAYADQTGRDYEALRRAVDDGRIEAWTGAGPAIAHGADSAVAQVSGGG